MPLGRRLFSFAVIADTHVNQEEGKASSDFAVNRLANARARHVIHALNRAKPAFALHLGDIVHPAPSHAGYSAAADSFHALAEELECALYLTPGNHDVGDKPGDWLPVPSVNEEYLRLYEKHFGSRHFSFDAEGCHFVVTDAQVINSGLPAEAVQRQWLEEDLRAHDGERTFLCTHYPPFLLDRAEEGHYDNIDDPGRSWLLGLLARHRVEALFAGHVHNFWYHRFGETDFYLLPSTAFVRLDYSELYRVEPGPEQGRNDAPKLGYLMVNVHEQGHVAHPLRTDGACLGPGESLAAVETLAPVHTRSIGQSPLGIDLRYPWAEITDVAASGALDEFSRKRARNDYPLLALWEMGIRGLRVPLADLLDERIRDRMRALQGMGHEFTVYSHGVPEGAAAEGLADNADLLSGWEVIAPLAAVGELAPRVLELRKSAVFEVRLSKLRRPGDPLHHGERARHVIEHGFLVSEEEQIASILRMPGMRRAFDGVLYRIPRDDSPWSAFARIAQTARSLGTRDCAYVRLAAENPARFPREERGDARRVAEALFASHAMPDVGAWLDTLADVDRGYFPRLGLVDRRFNPRLAGRVCRHLNSLLGSAIDGARSLAEFRIPEAKVLELRVAEPSWSLILPDQPLTLEAIPATTRVASASAKWIDLATGIVSGVRWRAGDAGTYTLETPVHCDGPVIVAW